MEPGQTGAASQATSGLTPSPAVDTAIGSLTIPSSSLFNQQGAQAAIQNLGQQIANQTGAAALTSFTNAPGAANGKFNFMPNSLDSYANYTYHIRFSITTEADAAAVQQSGPANFANGVPKIVIAESGTTALYNITEFTIENLVPGNDKTTTTQDIQCRMTVVEPYGFTLMDNLWNASLGIGIKNYFSTSSFFIEVWFTGYNEDGSIATPTLQSNLYKVWMVSLKDIESDTTESGTTYKITMLPHNMYGHADHVSVVASAVNIGPVTTVGAFFDQLALVMTAQNANLYEDKSPRIKYVIQTPKWMRSWQFDQSPTTSQRNSDISVSSGSVNRPTISVGRGMDMVTVLNFVMSMTHAGQRYTAGEPSTNNSGASAAAPGGASIRLNGMANLITVHTNMMQPVFDTTLNDYVRKVTYTFIPYATGRPVIDQKNAANARQPAQTSARQQAYAQSHRYVKHYFWTYTGQNLDVVKFDLKINWVQQTGIMSQLGSSTYANYSVGPQYNNDGVANQKLQEYQTAKQNQQTAQTTVNNLQKAIGASGSSSALTAALESANQQLNQYTSQITNLIQNNPNVPFQQIAVNQGIAAEASAAAAKAAKNVVNIAKTAAANIKADNSNPHAAQNVQLNPITLGRKISYLEDVGTAYFNPNPIPLSFRANQEPTDQNTTQGSDGPQQNSNASSNAANLQPSRSLTASILTEMQSKALSSIDLDIRGDPYWLGIGNILEDLAIGDGNQPDPSNPNAAWWFHGDVGFVFTMRTGTTYNESTGIMEFNDRTLMWDGFYSITKVINTFKSGQFMQTLHAVKDNLTQIPPAAALQNNSNLSPGTRVAAQGSLEAAKAVAMVNPKGLGQ